MSTIRPPKTVKDRLKILSPKKLEQLKQKPRAPIGQPGKIQINIKGNNEIPGSTFKLPSAKFDTVPSASRTKSSTRTNKQCNAHGSTKSLQRFYSIECMNCDTDLIVTNLNLEDMINNYDIWNHLTEDKQISSIFFLNVNHLYIIHIYSNVCKQMTDIKLLLFHSNTQNRLTVCKQMIKSK